MYGLVNKAIKDLVTDNYGEETWVEICERANFEDLDFISMSPYPDKLTFDLVGAASEVLSVPAEDLLFAFGEYWILYTAEKGYGNMLDLSGDTFPKFLKNMNMLHERVNASMPKLQPPVFSVRNETESSLELVYASHRTGLIPMLKGLISGLGKRFDLSVESTHISEENGAHVFKITW
ncbi:MAG: heme NO-binding domain-containing protein [Cryomorphaceae bacterium]|jgi:hypothetical protein|nr:heme NO-binding domain-containing protein [Cryomorphaceae bacterium]